MLKKDMSLSKEKKNGEFFVNGQKTTALKSPPPPLCIQYIRLRSAHISP